MELWRGFPNPSPRLTTFPSLEATSLQHGRAVANPKANVLTHLTGGHMYRAMTTSPRKFGFTQIETLSPGPSAAQGSLLGLPGRLQGRLFSQSTLQRGHICLGWSYRDAQSRCTPRATKHRSQSPILLVQVGQNCYLNNTMTSLFSFKIPLRFISFLVFQNASVVRPHGSLTSAEPFLLSFCSTLGTPWWLPIYFLWSIHCSNSYILSLLYKI